MGSSGEKFLWYAPHSRFSNRVSEFKNAIVIATILNRTLIVPLILDHHVVALGSCPKFKVLDPNELRFKVWNHSVELIHDHRTTIWTYQIDDNGVLDAFQPDGELKKKRKISFLKRRKDIYKTLGPGSIARAANVLALRSLFTAPYKGFESHIDIHEAPRDQRIQSLIQKIELLPFVPEILNVGKKFALHTIKASFL